MTCTVHPFPSARVVPLPTARGNCAGGSIGPQPSPAPRALSSDDARAAFIGQYQCWTDEERNLSAEVLITSPRWEDRELARLWWADGGRMQATVEIDRRAHEQHQRSITPKAIIGALLALLITGVIA